MEPYLYEDISIDDFLYFETLSPPFPILSSMRSLNNMLEYRELILPHKRTTYKNSSGYPVELFLTPPASQFLCQICKMVVKKPAECSKCGELFCEACIVPESILTPSTKAFCNACNCMITPKSPSKLLIKLISEQKIKCKNSELGCTHTFVLDDLNKHEMVCPFRQVSCMNYENCGNIGYLKDFRESNSPSRMHVRGNGWCIKPYTCSEGCQKFIKFKDMIKEKQNEVALREYLEVLNEIKKISEE